MYLFLALLALAMPVGLANAADRSNAQTPNPAMVTGGNERDGVPAAAPAPSTARDGDGLAAKLAITDVETSWDALGSLFLGTGDATAFGDGTIFVVSGKLTNRAEKPIHHAVLRYELLDPKGAVLYAEEGYNRSAEKLTHGQEEAPGDVSPIAAGATDSFRMIFFAEEIPRFETHRVTVIEAK